METGQRVLPLELFFDLVFVFALTQVTGYIANDPTWTRLAEGLAILAVLWWAWVSYAWLGNTAGSDDGVVRIVLLADMGAMLVASLAVPRAFGGDGLVFGVAYSAASPSTCSRSSRSSAATWGPSTSHARLAPRRSPRSRRSRSSSPPCCRWDSSLWSRALIGYEVRRYAEARGRIRHGT